MTICWTLLGTFGQLMLGYLLFMLGAFSAGDLATGNQFRPENGVRGNLSTSIAVPLAAPNCP